MKKQKVLIVDDMLEIYKQISRNFEEEPDYSSSVKDALKKMREGEYTKVITDYHLGVHSPKGGLDIVKAAHNQGIECVLMSIENHEKEALEAGASKFIFKKEILKNKNG